MSNEIKYLLFAIIILIVWYCLSISISRYRINYEIRQKEIAEKQKEIDVEIARQKCVKFKLDNPIFLEWLSSYFIVFDGAQGAGKTFLANAFLHFCYYHELDKIKKHRRQYKYLDGDYLEKIEKLEEQELLPIASNIDLIDRETGCKSTNNWKRVLEQKDPIVKNIGGIFIDELRKEFPKSLSNETRKQNADPALKAVEDSGKFIRQKLGVHIVGTEQTQSNFWKGLRDAGQKMVHCKKTIVGKTKFGKFLLKLGNFFMAILPAFLTLNVLDVFRKDLFFYDRIKSFFKLLIPAYFSFPFQYYFNKRAFYNWVCEHFTYYQVYFETEGRHCGIRFTNKDIFQYNTIFFRQEYEEKLKENEKLKNYQFKEELGNVKNI